ncbi:MAG TPA: phosphate ABC transporter ATP-binding protein, partial [Verrucomicrobiales bacterium]|nr:phosphate ABC transporter ATP-binding protein [Verrucomicrobiales bacterium]
MGDMTQHVLQGVSLSIYPGEYVCIMGPSGCGKSTLIKTVNRIIDLVPGSRVEGRVIVGDQDVLAPDVHLTDLRQRIGMVFQRANPFPKSI